MDEDDNNVANSSSNDRINSVDNIIEQGEEEEEPEEAQEEDFDDDDDLLDTIEVTVTTDGAPLPRDDVEDIEIINLSPNQQHLTGASAISPTININAPPLLNLSEEFQNWPWETLSNNEETDDAMISGSSSGPSTSTRANALLSVMSSSAHSGDVSVADEAASSSSGGAGAVPSYCFDTSSFCSRTRKEVAALIVAQCCSGGPTPDLNYIMDRFFNPSTPIDNPDNISWIRWLIAGGRTISDFVKIGKFISLTYKISVGNNICI